MLRTLFLSLLVAGLSACGTTNVGLNYTPAAGVSPASAGAEPIAVGAFADQRGEPPTWLGAIRGGFGNPLKTLESDQPVSVLVQQAFVAGLKARGVTVSAAGKRQLSGVIRHMDCSQYARREANVDIEIVVRDGAGAERFRRAYKASQLDGSLLTLSAGVFASVDDLRVVMERTLNEAVDKALDDPELRAALAI